MGARLGYGDKRAVSEATAAAADRKLIGLIESEAAALLQSCSGSFAQLLQLLQSVHAVAAASHAAADGADDDADGAGAGGSEDGEGGAVDGAARAEVKETAPMIFDDRVRVVRRTKALLDTQHDMLTQLMLRRADQERLRYWESQGVTVADAEA
mmetsp:Transcript_23024/g.67680  ORF Transcript_23024/g.67680 Transcript_23024/m.67680 type:complete len:154 (+) Transcript_23024:1-462(+)